MIQNLNDCQMPYRLFFDFSKIAYMYMGLDILFQFHERDPNILAYHNLTINFQIIACYC